MAELTAEIVDVVVAACQAGAADAAQAIGRALGEDVRLSVGSPETLRLDAMPPQWRGPGLAVVLKIGTGAMILVIPESGGVVPAWCAQPDATGQSKLATLAQELAVTLVPETLSVEDFRAVRVANLAGALTARRSGGRSGGHSFELSSGKAAGKPTTAALIWPIPRPTLAVGSGTVQPAAEAKPPTPPRTKPAAPAQRPTRKPAVRVRDLPAYTRSLLQIAVPVVVTLAEKRQTLGRITELGPGSIIQFDKSCEEMLDLSVGNHRIACGEAVKVGDKFGLRITAITLPQERFYSVGKGKAKR